jgi:hypothetical protein
MFANVAEIDDCLYSEFGQLLETTIAGLSSAINVIVHFLKIVEVVVLRTAHADVTVRLATMRKSRRWLYALGDGDGIAFQVLCGMPVLGRAAIRV